MDEPPSDRCGYTWPADVESEYETDEQSGHQSCCYRETAPGSNRCVWHADPADGTRKTVEALRDARSPAEIREQTSSYAELLDGANLSGVELDSSMSFEGVALRHAEFSGADLEGVDFTGADLRRADLADADLQAADFTGANLRETTLADATLRDATLADVTLTDANLDSADLTGADLRRTVLPRADLRRAALPRVSLWDADLTEASLWDADLADANLRRATLTDAVLFRADFTGAVLFRANLAHADLRESTLTGANLREADCAAADLRGATLSGADLRRTTLIEVAVSQATECGRQTRAQEGADSASDWDEIAQAYHTLVSTFSEHGLVGKARAHYLLEREARGEEANADGDRWGYFGSLASRYLTGYGVDYRRVLVVMGVVFGLSTLWYWVVEVEGNVLYFSVVTFTTAPPTIPSGTWTQAVAMVQTFVGTLLVVLLGYVLGNREQF